jgi:hypothetical protein
MKRGVCGSNTEKEGRKMYVIVKKHDRKKKREG